VVTRFTTAYSIYSACPAHLNRYHRPAMAGKFQRMAPTDRSRTAIETEQMLRDAGFTLTDEGRERARRLLAEAEAKHTPQEREARRQTLLARLNAA
jgi:hypothetical protein